MTDSDHALDAIARTADELVPALTDRLRRHGLGEIEIVDGDLRLRLRSGGHPEGNAGSPAPGARAETPVEPGPEAAATADRDEGGVPVGSPAVGFFVYADGLGPGLAVAKGDALGHVEVLGVRHEVRAPRGGTVRNLVAESGEAVEYGQTVVELHEEAER